MLQEIQVRGGVKKRPHPSGGGGGGVDFFWNNPTSLFDATIMVSSKCLNICKQVMVIFLT